MSMDIFKGKHRRFFHDIAQVSSQCQLSSFSFAQTCLDKQDFPTDSRPSQACDHSGIIISLIFVTSIFHHAQIILQILRLYLSRKLFIGSLQASQLPHDFGYLLIQFADTAFPCIRFDNRLDCLFRELDLFLRQSMHFRLFRNQVPGCNLYFLFLDISADFNQFHSIQQRLGNCIQIICRRNEHHMAQVIINVQIVIMESAVLLGVKDFQQGRCRITFKIARHFVYLIQDKHRIGCARFLQILDNPPAHRSDISTPVTTDFRFVMQSAQ